MVNLTGFHLIQVLLEVGDGGLFNERQGVLVHGFNPSFLERVLWAAAELGDEYGSAIVDGANGCFQAVFLAEAALDVKVHAAMAHELGARRAQLIDLKLLGVSEVLVDSPAALGSHGNQNLDVAAFAGQ